MKTLADIPPKVLGELAERMSDLGIPLELITADRIEKIVLQGWILKVEITGKAECGTDIIEAFIFPKEDIKEYL